MNTQLKYKRIPMDVRISNFVDASIELGFAGRDYLTRQETKEITKESGLPYPRWLAKNADRRIGRGKFSFPELAEANTVVTNVSPGHGTEGDDLVDLADMDTVMTTVDDDDNSLIATADDMVMLASDNALVMTDEDKIALGIMS